MMEIEKCVACDEEFEVEPEVLCLPCRAADIKQVVEELVAIKEAVRDIFYREMDEMEDSYYLPPMAVSHLKSLVPEEDN